MREIKFRCWNMHGKCMHDWDELVEKNKIHLLANQKSSYPIMQYTGLKDKNGVEVYEGDIVIKSGYGIYKKVVKWSDDGYMLPKTGQYRDGQVSCELKFEYEVIGNIHQNPELIEAP